MKYLFLFLSSLSCLAQGFGSFATDQPFFSGNSGTTSPFNFLSITNLYIELFSDDPVSTTNTVNGSSVVNTFDLTSYHNDFGAGGFGSPLISSSSTPAGKASWQFSGNGASESFTYKGTTLSNQPNTIFICAKWGGHTVANGWVGNLNTFCDASSGGREILWITDSGGGTPTFFAGTLTAPPTLTNEMWMIWTLVFNGTNSYVRTNWGTSTLGGVFFGSNPGTNSIGKMVIGADVNHQSTFIGNIEAVLVAQAVFPTNYLQTVEQALRTRAGF